MLHLDRLLASHKKLLKKCMPCYPGYEDLLVTQPSQLSIKHHMELKFTIPESY
jgi:hypothetical protein